MTEKTPQISRDKIKTVTDQRALVLWLAKEAKESSPQGDVPKGLIRLFDALIGEFAEWGAVYPPMSWAEWFAEVLPSMYDPNCERCSERVRWLISEYYGELVNRRARLEPDYFIKELVLQVLPRGAVDITRQNGQVKVSSSEMFDLEHGFKVRVIVREPKSRAAKITSRWLQEL
ncbi:hypothetical protein LB531_02970 [Mesorhizobium sp. CO1-1-2]|uniref:hypothetical protein n=1 Tax=unclassified Mesorhizobium TaxID=325217 RepID=UPI00112B7FB7|nr:MULTISPECIES: hypothetical protein [unclassified Mesorhizobium]MBZ9679615.1 hypothetical protein [Mesorhizobium sp. CO1-1-2]TPM02106.1 hypothetical protein FJ943_08435 [Mesorhizobium sp. B2-3-10]